MTTTSIWIVESQITGWGTFFDPSWRAFATKLRAEQFIQEEGMKRGAIARFSLTSAPVYGPTQPSPEDRIAAYDLAIVSSRAHNELIGLAELERWAHPYLSRGWLEAGRRIERLVQEHIVLEERRWQTAGDLEPWIPTKFMILPNLPLMLTAGEPS